MDVGSPEASGFRIPFRSDVVAELDAGEAIESAVGLLVDSSFAVGVGRDQARW